MGIEYDSGGNRYFASGSTALTTTGISSPVQIGAYTNWAQISASHYHGINIKTDGTLWTSGVNFHGILGKTTGATTSLSTAGKSSLAQIGALTDWKLSDCNQWMSAAVKTNGTLWVWGQNSSGQLGLGNTTSYSSPKQVGALTNWASVFNITGASAYIASKTFALKTDGTLWAWGKNIHYGAPFSVSSPVQIGKATWKTIIPAGRPDGTTPGVHGLVGIKTDGTLWALAIINNTFSNLITGKNNTVYQFSQIGTDSTWKTVSASGIRTGPGDGNPFVAATKTNGTLWTWGNGTGGKLGLGSTTSFSSPKQVGALTVWQDAIAIRKRTMALRS
jgi:alpha-tubulin suppressor-like RCC1 family protein